MAYFRPARVILFGSRARGDHQPDSDYDLLVVVDDDAPDEMVSVRAGYESCRGSGVAADVLPIKAGRHAQRLRLPGTLSHVIADEGVVVYERV